MPAAADTYKWVDARGVVNYSNAPPPEAAKASQVIEERISVMGMDPAVARWAQERAAQRAAYEQRDWELRQQSMQQASYYAQPYFDSQPYYSGYYAYPGFYAVRNRARFFSAVQAHPTPHAHGGSHTSIGRGMAHGGGRGR